MNIKETIMNKPFHNVAHDLQKKGIILRASKIDGEEIEDDEQHILNRLNVVVEDNMIVSIGKIG